MVEATSSRTAMMFPGPAARETSNSVLTALTAALALTALLPGVGN